MCNQSKKREKLVKADTNAVSRSRKKKKKKKKKHLWQHLHHWLQVLAFNVLYLIDVWFQPGALCKL